MNGPQHYAIAETLLSNLRRELPSGSLLHTTEHQSRMIAEAQVHATLALAAAMMDAANVVHWPGGTSTGPVDLDPSAGKTWGEVAS